MENKTINLGKLGNLEITPPGLAPCLEFVTIWATSENNPAILARVSAGAIGVCIDHHAKLPKYRPAVHKPGEYGHICLDRLLEYGVPSSKIYEAGSICLVEMSTRLPQEEELEETMDFFPQSQENTSG